MNANALPVPSPNPYVRVSSFQACADQLTLTRREKSDYQTWTVSEVFLAQLNLLNMPIDNGERSADLIGRPAFFRARNYHVQSPGACLLLIVFRRQMETKDIC